MHVLQDPHNRDLGRYTSERSFSQYRNKAAEAQGTYPKLVCAVSAA